MKTKVPTIPKAMANQNAKLIRKVDDITNDGERIHNDEITDLNHVVYQATTIYTGVGNDRQITANGVLFLYTGVTKPMPTITQADVGAYVQVGTDTFKITRIVENKHPFKDEVWSYEIEVL
ncbi:capsid protein [Weissella minor]|uniref:putative minor capsid protein n=1 Tax=Weissella minor TaxID=1620 RepID=UPI001BAF4FC0|nr:putative minor capsid protein [Weissella minor]MBS0949522.1 capsid protein [Weissella minor]